MICAIWDGWVGGQVNDFFPDSLSLPLPPVSHLQRTMSAQGEHVKEYQSISET